MDKKIIYLSIGLILVLIIAFFIMGSKSPSENKTSMKTSSTDTISEPEDVCQIIPLSEVKNVVSQVGGTYTLLSTCNYLEGEWMKSNAITMLTVQVFKTNEEAKKSLEIYENYCKDGTAVCEGSSANIGEKSQWIKVKNNDDTLHILYKNSHIQVSLNEKRSYMNREKVESLGKLALENL